MTMVYLKITVLKSKKEDKFSMINNSLQQWEEDGNHE